MATVYTVVRLGTWNGEDMWYRDTDPHDTLVAAEREAERLSQASGTFEVWSEHPPRTDGTVESRWHNGKRVPHYPG